MSRSICIGYKFEKAFRNRHIEVPQHTRIEIQSPYDLFGTQSTSLGFWNQPGLRRLGITRLSRLGESDPIIFSGWKDLEDLWREIQLLQLHFGSLDYDAETKARWLSHLVYCYFMLAHTAPPESIPYLSIG